VSRDTCDIEEVADTVLFSSVVIPILVATFAALHRLEMSSADRTRVEGSSVLAWLVRGRDRGRDGEAIDGPFSFRDVPDETIAALALRVAELRTQRQ
jgi:hypothetical protein